MLDEELARLVNTFQNQVLDLLTRMINAAFEQAMSARVFSQDTMAATTRVPRLQHSERPKAKRRRPRRQRAVQNAAALKVPVPSDDRRNEASDATSIAEAPQPRSRRTSKGPSRDEIDRLVQAGLESRLAGENPSAAAS